MTLDEAALFDTGQGGQDDEQPEPVPLELPVHASAIVYQARALTFGDLLDCGPGMVTALEGLALALGTEPARLEGAALDLIAATCATDPHRELLDTTPPGRSPADGAHEMYPRDIHAVAPRYTHADRRAPLIGSIRLMAGHLERNNP